jgi:hypothetical protein
MTPEASPQEEKQTKNRKKKRKKGGFPKAFSSWAEFGSFFLR